MIGAAAEGSRIRLPNPEARHVRFSDEAADRRTGPAEGSPSSAGSCVPAIGYPLRGPRCVGRGAEGAKRRSHRPYRSVVDAVGRQQKSSVSATSHLCSIPNANPTPEPVGGARRPSPPPGDVSLKTPASVAGSPRCLLNGEQELTRYLTGWVNRGALWKRPIDR